MEDRETPTVSILLLGDPDCGKSTFLSRLSHGQNAIHTKAASITLLHDLDQPFEYNIRMYNRPYHFEFYDTASPEHYTLLRPDFIIICYDITDRRSLINAQFAWRKESIRQYERTKEDIPVMLLGLKRDLRREEEGVIYPQELTRDFERKGHRIAGEMRCDRYAECSALTGELMNEVFEDIAKVAARTTTEGGGLTEGGCIAM